MPSPGAAHRKASQGDAVFVNRVVLAGGFDAFKHIGLTRPAVGNIGAPENFDLQKIGRWHRLRLIVGDLFLREEVHLYHSAIGAVKKNVQASRLASVVGGWNCGDVRLRAAIHSRTEGTDDSSGRGGP